MKSVKDLRNVSLYFVLGIALIYIGLFIFSCKNPAKVIAPVVTITPSPLNVSYSQVIRVYDGDTVQISSGEKVRYIGIDSAEVYPVGQCFSQEARQENENLIMGEEVKLVRDVSDTDKYGRLLRYVYVGDKFINDELTKNGFAKVMTVPPDIKFADDFTNSEKYAKENSLGLWKNCRN